MPPADDARDSIARAVLEDASGLIAKRKFWKALARIETAIQNLDDVRDAEFALEVLDLLNAEQGDRKMRVRRLVQDVRAEMARLERESGGRERIAAMAALEDRLCRLWLLDGRSSDSYQLPLVDSEVRAAVRPLLAEWGSELFDGYDRGRASLADTHLGALRESRRQMERALKALAVELIAEGAEVRGLANDSIPLVAFALVHGHLPTVVGGDQAETEERANDALLSKADFAAALEPRRRPLFLLLHRLAFLLGAAQVYAEQLALTRLEVR